MRLALVLLFMVGMVGVAVADTAGFLTNEPLNLPDVRDAIYCQAPSSGWGAMNASEPFDAEMADDIPADLAGSGISGVTLYMAQWGGGHQGATSVDVNFYFSACPPGMTADLAYTVPWGDITVTNVYAGSWYVDQLDIPLPEGVTIVNPMSIGWQINNDWGQNPPYCGSTISDAVQGCEGYWAGDYWGYPRWTAISSYYGTPYDMAYCLEGGAVATEETTWGSVKSLYR